MSAQRRWHDDPVTVDATWTEPRSSWCAKAERARVHIDSLRQQIAEFMDTGPYSLKPEQTEVPDRWAYRLRHHGEIPIEISTTVGDVLHNLRAALDNLAFELARRNHGGNLTPAQERLSSFPITTSPADFDRFMSERGRDQLYGARAREALRAAQWWVLQEELPDILGNDYDDRARWDPVRRLNELWNVDKHRRLQLTVWRPGLLAWWTSAGATKRELTMHDQSGADGSIVFYVDGTDVRYGNEVEHGFNLAFAPDPALVDVPDYAHDILAEMEEFHHYVTNDAFLKIFEVMSRDA